MFQNEMRLIFVIQFYVYCIVDFVYQTIMEKSQSISIEESVSEQLTEKKDKIAKTRSSIKLFFNICGIITVFLFIMKLRDTIFLDIFLAFSIVYMGYIMFISIFGVLRYIFHKPFDYYFSKLNETNLFFMGLLFFYISKDLGKFGDTLAIKAAHLSIYILDLLKVTSLILWYFQFFFLFPTLFLLTLHKVAIIWRIKAKKSPDNGQAKFMLNNAAPIELARKHEEFFDANPIKNNFLRVLNQLLWIVCVLFDATIGLVLWFLKYIFHIIFRMFSSVIENVRKILSKVFINLEKNQGKTIIIISRYSIIVSLTFILFLDKYNNLFSEPGGEIYEFICSVVIIPFVFSQILEIKESVNKT